MAFADLDTLELRDFVVQERDHDALWTFMHIPKTAGSSFSESMQTLLMPYKNINVDYLDTSKSHNEKLTDAVTSFIEENAKHKFRSASGHITFDLVDRIKLSEKNTKVVTFLRDPISRLISDYRYQRTSAHPPYLDFINRFPVIEDYIDSPESQNKIARFIAGRGVDLNSVNLTERLDYQFSFVGLLEMYPMSYNLMFNIFGIPHEFPKLHSRKTPDIAETKVSINDNIKNKILEKNPLDALIYNHVRSRLVKHRDTWAGYSVDGFPDAWNA